VPDAKLTTTTDNDEFGRTATGRARDTTEIVWRIRSLLFGRSSGEVTIVGDWLFVKSGRTAEIVTSDLQILGPSTLEYNGEENLCTAGDRLGLPRAEEVRRRLKEGRRS
jgi:hypothetical protein